MLLPGEQEFGPWAFGVSEGAFDAREAARPEVAYLDASLGPYRVRTVREGDTIRPLGLGGTKKVYKAMKDRKVPRDVRLRMPVVVDRHGEVAWVPLGELDEGHKVVAAVVVGGGREQAVRLEVLRSAWR
ncbi:tRNA lysidine(34) synthetase TilS [Rubrobacter marinus]|uniref:tRNA lysidine(34) synthetase TilS n=1 Tax=Rubrobacter marinus TaxID=2653852 RepID=UPI001D1934D1|nr:tRNA lysidine(34) synthetase TilS [Rubrobacter marinus]